jgi:RNA polymerase sigma-70 factor (ECF subfamily)
MTTTDLEELRRHGFAVAYRMLGSVADAEDLVQEALLRLSREEAPVREPAAWITTVTTRLAIDHLRLARVRRESYVGPWLPEPLLTTGEPDDPLAAVVRDEGVRMAAMLVLERLSPPQRVAFVLHEAMDLPFAAIADILGCPEATARQHASRARRLVAAADPPPRAALAEQQAVLAAFADAMARADHDALVALLHPDVVFYSDSDGQVRAALRPVAGPDKVARLLLGLLAKYGPGMLAFRPVLVNGEPGVLSPASGGASAAVNTFALRDGRIVGIYGVLNPAKLTRLPG